MRLRLRLALLFLSILLILAAILDIRLWFDWQVPYSNRLYRILSGAPEVHVNGELLMYSGTVKESPGYFEPYKISDEGMQLYKAGGIGEMKPPWIFIPQSDGQAYRYKYPKTPWGF